MDVDLSEDLEEARRVMAEMIFSFDELRAKQEGAGTYPPTIYPPAPPKPWADVVYPQYGWTRGFQHDPTRTPIVRVNTSQPQADLERGWPL